MRLYLMRHGPAEDHAASGRDFDRALIPSGRERVRDVARALVEGGEVPHLIFTSPLVRALQTAEIVAGLAQLAGGDALKAPTVEIRGELAPDGDSEAFALKVLSSFRERVMLVGHEPIMGEVSARLTSRESDFRAGLQKAMVVGLDSRDDDPADLPMHLRFVLEPKSLAWLHDARQAKRT